MCVPPGSQSVDYTRGVTFFCEMRLTCWVVRRVPCWLGLPIPSSHTSLRFLAPAPRCTWVRGWVLGAGGPPVDGSPGSAPAASFFWLCPLPRASWRGGDRGGVSRSHEGLQLSLSRSEEAPYPASALLDAPLQHFPCCLRTGARPWLPIGLGSHYRALWFQLVSVVTT